MLHARTDYNRIQDPEGKIGEDEPVLLFRAQDEYAPAVAAYYASLLREDGNVLMETAVLRHEARMLDWQETHSTKLPDMPEDALL